MAENTTLTAEGQAILANFKARIKPWEEAMATYIGKVVFPAFGLAGRVSKNATIAIHNAVVDAKVIGKEAREGLVKGWAGMHFCGDVIESLGHNALVDLRNLANKAVLKISNAGTKVTEKAKTGFYKAFEGTAVGIAEHLHNAKERIRSVGQLFTRIKGLEGLVDKKDLAITNKVAERTYQLISQKAEYEQKAGYNGIYTNLLARYNTLNGEGKLDLNNPEVKAFLGSCYACCFFGREVFNQEQRKAVEAGMLEKLQSQTSVKMRGHYDKKLDTVQENAGTKREEAQQKYDDKKVTILEESRQSAEAAGKVYKHESGKISLASMLESAKTAFGNIVDRLSKKDEIPELKETKEKYIKLFKERVQADPKATAEEERTAGMESPAGGAPADV